MIVREFVNLIGFKINESQFRSAEARVNSLHRKMENFGRKATLFLTAPFIGLNVWLAKTVSEFEQLDVAFTTMLGSTEKADELVRNMLNFAAKTPFEIKEIGPTVKNLIAVGIGADNVLDTLKSLGDVAAGVSQPVGRIAYNFGQIKAQTKATARDLKDFAVMGIPIYDELAKMLGKTNAEIMDMTSKGLIKFDLVDQAFKKMTSSGGKFDNLMVKQSKTVGGMWSNFIDLITLTVKDYEKELIPMFKGIIKFLIKLLDLFKNGLSPTMKRTLFVLAGLTAVIGPLILAFTLLVNIGMAVRTALLAVSAAARVANMSTSLFLLKFALMGVALVGSIALAIALFEDITIYLKGGNSLIGRIINRFNELNNKLKSMGSFTLNQVKNVLKSLDNLLQSQIDFWVGLFMGKWKFALESLKNIFINAFKTIGNILGVAIQPILDLINIISGSKLDVSKVGSGISSMRKVTSNSFDPKKFAGMSGFQAASTSFKTNVNLTLPNNPTQDQMDKVSSSVQSTIDEAISKASRNLVLAYPEVE